MEFDFVSAMAVIVGGIITPFITAIFTNPNMQSTYKRVIALTVSAVVGAVFAIGSGLIVEVPDVIQLRLVRVVVIIALVTSLAQGYYMQFKDSVRQVESATHNPRRAKSD